MFIIRQVQMDALGEIAVREFEARLVVQLHQTFPEKVAAAGEARMRKLVSLGVQRARAHGFQSERDTALYVNVMFILGPEFESDPRYTWAAELLRGVRADPAEIAKRLYLQASDVVRSALAGREAAL